MSRKHSVIAALFVLPALVEGASFDCAKASSKVEKLICRDAELSELDSNLAARYERALKEAGVRSALRDQQRQWLRDVRNRCSDVTCLRAAYNQRSEMFEWIAKQGQNDPICEEFRGHQAQRLGLSPYRLEEKETGRNDPNFSIPNIDVDGDNLNDQILLFRTGSASLIPPDNSSLSLVLSSTGETFTIEMQRFFVIGYKSSYYVLAADWLGESGPVRSDIYRLERQGIKKLCSDDCGLPDGSCGHR